MAKAFAQQSLQSLTVEIAEPETCEGAPPVHETPAADPPTDSQKRFRQRRGNPGQLSSRDHKRQTKAQIFPHIAMLCEHNLLAPVTGIGQAVVRATTIHPLLALGCVMMRQRKVRAAIAKAFTYRDAFGIQRVGDPATRSLRIFPVNVPTLEMLDGAGIHHDQRRMDERGGLQSRP